MRIGIDLMGGTVPPEQLMKAVLEAAADGIHEFRVYATEDLPGLPVVLAEEYITMEDDPLESIKRKPNSSLLLGIQDLKANAIDALISIGNTGALVAAASLFLEKKEGVLRPGLLALLPTKSGVVAVIDVGANVSCKPQHLLQYAHMGSEYMQKRFFIEKPRVALLNIGEESYKGFPLLREAYQLLENSPLHFVGNVEGTRAFEGAVDVIVTDGFTGNIFLKASEGMASFIFEEGKPQPRFNYEEYPGALLCGLTRTVIKCHGNSSPKALLSAIRALV